MSSDFISEDLRSVKTKKALYTAMFSLLRSLSFKKITVKEICEEALISRAAFYTHFIDKYDLLKHWIPKLWPKDFNTYETFEQAEEAINSYMNKNLIIFKNLFYDADSETSDILYNFILSTINLSFKKASSDVYQKNIVLSNFYAGGILSYFSWQIKNNFPQDIPLMNKYLYKMIHELQDWQLK